MPIPRPSAGSTESGIEITRMSTKIVAIAPSASTSRLSGTVADSSKPDLTQRGEREHREPDEEHELAEHPGVPADHGQLHADARSPRTSR